LADQQDEPPELLEADLVTEEPGPRSPDGS